jgi:hypothetical protein
MRFQELPADPIRLRLLAEVAEKLALHCRPAPDGHEPSSPAMGEGPSPLDMVKAERIVSRALNLVPEGPMLSEYVDWPFTWDRDESGDHDSPRESFRVAYREWSKEPRRQLDRRVPPVELIEGLRDVIKQALAEVGPEASQHRGTSLDDYRAEIGRIEDAWFEQRVASPQCVRRSDRSWWSGRSKLLREIDRRYGIGREDLRVYSIAAYKAELTSIEEDRGRQAHERRRVVEEDPSADPGYGRGLRRLQIRRLDLEARLFRGLTARSKAGEVGDRLELWRLVSLMADHFEGLSALKGHPGDPMGTIRKMASEAYSALHRLQIPWAPDPKEYHPGFTSRQYADRMRKYAKWLERDEGNTSSARPNPTPLPNRVAGDTLDLAAPPGLLNAPNRPSSRLVQGLDREDKKSFFDLATVESHWRLPKLIKDPCGEKPDPDWHSSAQPFLRLHAYQDLFRLADGRFLLFGYFEGRQETGAWRYRQVSADQALDVLAEVDLIDDLGDELRTLLNRRLVPAAPSEVDEKGEHAYPGWEENLADGLSRTREVGGSTTDSEPPSGQEDESSPGMRTQEPAAKDPEPEKKVRKGRRPIDPDLDRLVAKLWADRADQGFHDLSDIAKRLGLTRKEVERAHERNRQRNRKAMAEAGKPTQTGRNKSRRN